MSTTDILQFAISHAATERDILEAHVADLNARVAQVARDQGPTDRDLFDVIETIANGFALWDADDRLVVCNGKYRNLYPMAHDLFVKGASFRDIVAECARRGQYAETGIDLEVWVESRVLLHQAAVGRHEELLSDGRRLLAHERRLANGGVVGVRVDITEAVRR